MVAAERCSWCGSEVDPGDGFRAFELEGARRAAFCRLEHVVPWALHGAHWAVAAPGEAGPSGGEEERCSRCGEPVGPRRVLLVRHRGEHRIADAFCGVEHLREWATAGGRWA